MERDLAPNDVLAINMCGPFTPSLSENFYMLYGVDHVTGYIVNYGLHPKSEALAVFKRCVVDMTHKAGTTAKCVRGDGDALWTSSGFVEFCDSMGIAREHSPPGAQLYNGVAESAIQRCKKVGIASRRSPFGARGFFVHQRHGSPWRQALGRVGERRGTEARPIGFSLQPRTCLTPGAVYQHEGAVQGAAFSPGGLHERNAAEQAGG